MADKFILGPGTMELVSAPDFNQRYGPSQWVDSTMIRADDSARYQPGPPPPPKPGLVSDISGIQLVSEGGIPLVTDQS